MPTIHLVAAARPNFMKVAPLWHALRREAEWSTVLVHTGQHHDEALCGALLRDLSLPEPDIALHIGSGTHAKQTGGVMIAYEQHLARNRPDLVVVVGDVNATPGAALAAVKLGIPVAHLEAGLRSGDRTMPEEINRIVTDAVSHLLWTPSEDADVNLRREGVAPERIARVGNIMIDTLRMLRPRIDTCDIRERLNLGEAPHAVVTLHRPANVDDADMLATLCAMLGKLAEETRLVFPVHPRTRTRMETFGLLDGLAEDGRIVLTEPLSYIPFMRLVSTAAFVVTDSGGVQEETTVLGIPCVTLRTSTERPVTVLGGTNILTRPEGVDAALAEVRKRTPLPPPPLWDGHTAERVCEEIRHFFRRKPPHVGEARMRTPGSPAL